MVLFIYMMINTKHRVKLIFQIALFFILGTCLFSQTEVDSKTLETVDFWERVVPLPYAREYLNRMYKDGHKIVIVTASHPKTVDAKLNKALYPYFDFITYKDVIVAYDKSCIKADVLIDDGPHNFDKFDGLKLLIDAPHNQNANTHHYRVKNLKEAYEKLNEAL